jgi:phosphatidylserine/phosphatidylglycerophosphate/cardiolipin synthase-like enzyme
MAIANGELAPPDRPMGPETRPPIDWSARPLLADDSAVVRLVLNDEHLDGVLAPALARCRHRLFIATADVKDVHIPFPVGAGKSDCRRGRAVSVVETFTRLTGQGVDVRLLHGGVPSGPLLGRLKAGVPAGLKMRRCPRVHVKAVVADGRWMYLGSANLTGAGLGAKSAGRRNFEGGVWTDEVALIDPVLDMLEAIWSGSECKRCGRKRHCPVPLEEPNL